jgi:hypothetical protein
VQEQLAALDRLIASKARKVEREARELRALVRQREQLASETTRSTEDTDGKEEARLDRSLASA